jgi:hypothetical protein
MNTDPEKILAAAAKTEEAKQAASSKTANSFKI